MHERWSDFLTQRGYAIRQHLGTPRAFAQAPSTDTAATRCVDLNHFTAMSLVGADARAFLQGYLTCDLDELSESHALVGAYCNLKGRVVADVTVVLYDGQPTLVLHGSLRETVAASLKKYLAFSRSRFAAADAAPILLGIIDPPSAPAAADPLHVVASGAGVAVAVPGTVSRSLLVLPHADAAALWDEYGSRAETGDASNWDLLDVRSGIAHVCATTTEQFLPQMLDYDRHGAVSFTKGCYLGQEIIARTQHLGRPKRHLHRLAWRGAATPEVGAALLRPDQSRAGTLVGVAAAGDGYGEALAVLNDDIGGPLQTAGVTYLVA